MNFLKKRLSELLFGLGLTFLGTGLGLSSSLETRGDGQFWGFLGLFVLVVHFVYEYLYYKLNNEN